MGTHREFWRRGKAETRKVEASAPGKASGSRSEHSRINTITAALGSLNTRQEVEHMCQNTAFPGPPNLCFICYPPKEVHGSRVLAQVSPADPAASQHPPALLLRWSTPEAVLRGG